MQSKKKGIGYGHTHSKSELKTLLHDIWRAQKIKADRHETCSRKSAKKEPSSLISQKFLIIFKSFHRSVLLQSIFSLWNFSVDILKNFEKYKNISTKKSNASLLKKKICLNNVNNNYFFFFFLREPPWGLALAYSSHLLNVWRLATSMFGCTYAAT